MRPIERGVAPREYTKYQDAIDDLTERLGWYCSYCERRLPVSLAVEHIKPKSLNSELETEWTNFLLGCTNCNSTKGNKEVKLEEYLWPDRDNTFQALTYSRGGFVQITENLLDTQKQKAQALLDLVGLQRHPASENKPTDKDKRWQQREEAWQTATIARGHYETLERQEEAKELVLTVAINNGFFSVWMSVFADYPEIKTELIKSFPGTASSCFDAEGNPVNRPSGNI